ncbi:E2 ubiquitin-conjugating-like enzyme [Scenedesmus sp. NREL 46B-D3]|nr:E2 ubiquitin-conjugating-like enzyme [Scenedesmus sp. NREL 46B-D3]
MSLATARLAQERKAWRKDKPFGFIAKPKQAPDGSVNIKKWNCYIPGKADTPWADGLYPLQLHFADSYPDTPPQCCFPAGFFHPNVYTTGHVCLSIISPQPHGSWKPSITISQILVGIQELLDTPNCGSPAQMPAHHSYTKQRAAYTQLIRKQAARYPPSD